MAVCTPRREASGGTGRARTQIPSSTTGRDKSQPEPWGGLWDSPGPTRRTGTVPPGTDRGGVPPCSYETCQDPQLHLPHLGVGLKLLEQARSVRSQASSVQTCGPPSLPLPPGCPWHPLPARLQGTDLLRVLGVSPALNLGLSGRGSATAERLGRVMPKSLSWTWGEQGIGPLSGGSPSRALTTAPLPRHDFGGSPVPSSGLYPIPLLKAPGPLPPGNPHT